MYGVQGWAINSNLTQLDTAGQPEQPEQPWVQGGAMLLVMQASAQHIALDTGSLRSKTHRSKVAKGARWWQAVEEAEEWARGQVGPDATTMMGAGALFAVAGILHNGGVGTSGVRRELARSRAKQDPGAQDPAQVGLGVGQPRLVGVQTSKRRWSERAGRGEHRLSQKVNYFHLMRRVLQRGDNVGVWRIGCVRRRRRRGRGWGRRMSQLQLRMGIIRQWGGAVKDGLVVMVLEDVENEGVEGNWALQSSEALRESTKVERWRNRFKGTVESRERLQNQRECQSVGESGPPEQCGKVTLTRALARAVPSEVGN
ncbi:hypothetical protein EDB85DRAFT_1888061 [Lactarius pseudohatsudake]|nr:hypothetical protein EDB85DRAFT_1888061 [Lactarius pseudohatsudake]